MAEEHLQKDQERDYANKLKQLRGDQRQQLPSLARQSSWTPSPQQQLQYRQMTDELRRENPQLAKNNEAYTAAMQAKWQEQQEQSRRGQEETGKEEAQKKRRVTGRQEQGAGEKKMGMSGILWQMALLGDVFTLIPIVGNIFAALFLVMFIVYFAINGNYRKIPMSAMGVMLVACIVELIGVGIGVLPIYAAGAWVCEHWLFKKE